MDIEHARWEEYEARFRKLAEQVDMQKGPKPELGSSEAILFLYGENGLSPEEEFAMLARLEQQGEQLKGTEITTSYWEDLVLYL